MNKLFYKTWKIGKDWKTEKILSAHKDNSGGVNILSNKLSKSWLSVLPPRRQPSIMADTVQPMRGELRWDWTNAVAGDEMVAVSWYKY